MSDTLPPTPPTIGDVLHAILGIRDELHLVSTGLAAQLESLRLDVRGLGVTVLELDTRVGRLELHLDKVERYANEQASLLQRVVRLEQSRAPDAAEYISALNRIAEAFRAANVVRP